MTRKSLDKQLDVVLDAICEARGLNPAVGVKGGQREVAHSLLSLAISQTETALLTACGVAPPIVS